jgi:hypothetical protein
MTPGKRTGVAARNARKTMCTLCPGGPHPYDYRLNNLGQKVPYCKARAKENMARWGRKKKEGPRPVTGALAWIYEAKGPEYGRDDERAGRV